MQRKRSVPLTFTGNIAAEKAKLEEQAPCCLTVQKRISYSEGFASLILLSTCPTG
jgi:hypothetical protein